MVWRLVAHHRDEGVLSDMPGRALDWIIGNSRIAIGWSKVGDLREFGTAHAISEASRIHYPQNLNASVSGQQLWDFANTMQADDLVVVSANGKRRVVVRVMGDYEFIHDFPHDERTYAHQRQVGLTKLNADKVWQESGGMATGQTIYWTLIRCVRHPQFKNM